MTAVAQDAETASTPRNTPARISICAAALGATLIAGVFLTPLFWMLYGGLYTFLVFATGAVAIPAGHLGRRRGKRLGGRDRGVALLGIVTGWILVLLGLLLALAYLGLLAGLAMLTDSTS
ncbi:hypothetical protein [Kitasatospora indigofera]|uniref:hypothetical protein n=1 Tax=Kitasatospora indigofera TaxID=67307 RepID=UPI0033AB21D3